MVTFYVIEKCLVFTGAPVAKQEAVLKRRINKIWHDFAPNPNIPNTDL